LQPLSILVIGAGIGGLTAAIALRARGHDVQMIERDPTWSVYGVGIIQQGNVVRAMTDLGLIDDYLEAGFGFDHVEVFIPPASPSPRSRPPASSPTNPPMSASPGLLCTRCWATARSAPGRRSA
jgi:2-polyprenyl-6-methoxyphenol hydroxylase-like FAD-dependent oxidoreductase